MTTHDSLLTDNGASTRASRRIGGNPNEPPDDLPPADQIEASLTIDSPTAGALLAGPTVIVNGTANYKINGRTDNSQIKGVNVRLGASGSFEPATLTAGTPMRWSLTRNTSTNGSLAIMAQLIVDTGSIKETAVTIFVDSQAPTLTITDPSKVTTPSPTYTTTLTGTVRDAPAGVSSVAWRLGNTGPFTSASLQPENGWSALTTLPGLGDHTITVQAIDKVGHVTTNTATVQVIDNTPPF